MGSLGAGTGLGQRLGLGLGQGGDRGEEGDRGEGFCPGLTEGGRAWAEAASSGSEKPSLWRRADTYSLQEGRGPLPTGEEGREEQPRGLGSLRSSLKTLSLFRLNRDFTGLGGRAGGLVQAAASDSGRQHSRAAVRPDTGSVSIPPRNM